MESRNDEDEDDPPSLLLLFIPFFQDIRGGRFADVPLLGN